MDKARPLTRKPWQPSLCRVDVEKEWRRGGREASTVVFDSVPSLMSVSQEHNAGAEEISDVTKYSWHIQAELWALVSMVGIVLCSNLGTLPIGLKPMVCVSM